jgi:FkbM family methyltransferase
MKATNKYNLNELFSFDKDYYENKIRESFPDVAKIIDKKIPVVIYGAARLGVIFKTNLDRFNISIAAFADSNSKLWGRQIEGIKVISPDALREDYSHNPILIASLLYETEIYDMLRAMHFPLIYPLSFLNHQHPDIFPSPEYFQTFSSLFSPNNQSDIFEVQRYWVDDHSRKTFYNLIKFRLTLNKTYIKRIKSNYPQYFEPEIIHISPEEIFLDCGAYTGDTIEHFYKAASGRFKKVYSFEPDRVNFSKLITVAKRIDPLRIIPINCGVYESSGSMSFDEVGTIDTRLGSSNSSVHLPVVAIDDFLKSKAPATFIKMDIEGSEMQALLGARKALEQFKPKLAISVYHKASDLWQIPLFVKKLNKDYKIYLRHHTNEVVDTVCYAL